MNKTMMDEQEVNNKSKIRNKKNEWKLLLKREERKQLEEEDSNNDEKVEEEKGKGEKEKYGAEE